MAQDHREEGIKLTTAYFEIPSFRFEDGTILDVKLAYVSLNPSATKKALVPTCYQGRLNTTTTYSDSTRFTSLAAHHVVVVALLGNGESSSPSNTPGFPSSLDYRDQIRAQYRLVTEGLGITELDVVLGFSMGGQQSYYWAAMYPDFVKHAVCICGSARTSVHNYMSLEGVFSALTNSDDFKDGKYKEHGIERPNAGLKAFSTATAAWVFSPEWYRAGIWKDVLGTSDIKQFLDAYNASIYTWDANDLLAKGCCWQSGDVGVISGGLEKTLESIKARMLLLPCQTDQYFRPEDNEAELKHLKHAEMAIIPSIWGHAAAGGMSTEDDLWIDQKVGEFLRKSS